MRTGGRAAVVFQEHRLLPWKRVAGNIALGLRGPDAAPRTAPASAPCAATCAPACACPSFPASPERGSRAPRR
ncbi:hypothetical protein [Nonomuraea composti]|uniref:hypothetical protein n=1 Tax=Nonomuraea composti TaxID=2720023 RepID=UPI00197DCFFC